MNSDSRHNLLHLASRLEKVAKGVNPGAGFWTPQLQQELARLSQQSPETAKALHGAIAEAVAIFSQKLSKSWQNKIQRTLASKSRD